MNKFETMAEVIGNFQFNEHRMVQKTVLEICSTNLCLGVFDIRNTVNKIPSTIRTETQKQYIDNLQSHLEDSLNSRFKTQLRQRLNKTVSDGLYGRVLNVVWQDSISDIRTLTYPEANSER